MQVFEIPRKQQQMYRGNEVDGKYKELLYYTLQNGVWSKQRARTKNGKALECKSLFGLQIELNPHLDAFPVITTKRIHAPTIFHEFIWMTQGLCHSLDYLKKNKVTIWDEWADENGNLGPIYGCQWRNFNGQGIDQLQTLIDTVKKDPNSRRMLVSAWNPAQLQEMALPPCHWAFQVYCKNKKLHMRVDQRSVDLFLGFPYNISFYSLLLLVLCEITSNLPGDLIFSMGDVHIYENHLKQVDKIMSREPYDLPRLRINSKRNIDDFTVDDFIIENYVCHSKIPAEVAI